MKEKNESSGIKFDMVHCVGVGIETDLPSFHPSNNMTTIEEEEELFCAKLTSTTPQKHPWQVTLPSSVATYKRSEGIVPPSIDSSQDWANFSSAFPQPSQSTAGCTKQSPKSPLRRRNRNRGGSSSPVRPPPIQAASPRVVPTPTTECACAPLTDAFSTARSFLSTTSFASVADLVKTNIEDGVDGIVAKELQSRGDGGSSTECDYDINPTELYLAVQDGRWDDVMDRSKTHSHEASTWVYRQDDVGGKGAMKLLRWRLLPLHAAVIFRAPKEVVIALLVANSDSAACRDDQGKLPLHLSLRRRSGDAEFDEEVVSILTEAYPEGTRTPDNKGRTPIDIVEEYTNGAVRARLLRCLHVEKVKNEGQRSPLYAAALKKRQAKETRIDSELRAKLDRQRYAISPKRNHCREDDQDLAGEDDIGVEVEYDANKRMSMMSEKEEYDVDEMMIQEQPPVNEETLSQTLDEDHNDNNDQVEIQCTIIPVHQSTTPPLVRMAPPSLRDQMRARLEMRRPTGGGDALLLRAVCPKRDAQLPPSSPSHVTDHDITGGESRELNCTLTTIEASNDSNKPLPGTTSKTSQCHCFVDLEKDDLRERTDQIQMEDRDDVSESMDDRRDLEIDSNKPQTNAYVESLLDNDETSSSANSEHDRDKEFHSFPSVMDQIRASDDESRTNWIINDNHSRQDNELNSTPPEMTGGGGFGGVLPNRYSVEEANPVGTSTISVRKRILEMERIGYDDDNSDRLGRGMFMLGNSNHSVITISSSICSSTTGGASSTVSRGRRIELNKCDMRLRTLETMTEEKDETSEYIDDHPSFYQSPSRNLPSSYISNEWKMKYNCSPTETVATTQDTQIGEIHATEDYDDRYNIVKCKFERVKNETHASHLAKGRHLDLQPMSAPRRQHRTSLDELEVYNCTSMITAPTDDMTEDPPSSIYEEGSVIEPCISQAKQDRLITVSINEEKKLLQLQHHTSRLFTCESDIEDKYDLCDDENATPNLLKKAEHFFDSLTKDTVSQLSSSKSREESGSARSKFEMIMAKYENISSNGDKNVRRQSIYGRSEEPSQSGYDSNSTSSSRHNKYHTSRDNLLADSNEYGLDSSPSSFKGSEDVSRSSAKSLKGVFRNTNIQEKLLPRGTLSKSHVVDQFQARLQPSCSKDSTEFIMTIPQVRSFESDAVSALSMITGNTSIGSVSISTENSAVIESYVKSIVHNIVAYEVESTGSMKKELETALRRKLKLKAHVKKLAKQSHEILIGLEKERKANRIAQGKFNREMEIHLARKASEYEKYSAIAMDHAEQSKRRALELAQQDMEREVTLLKSQLDSVQSIGVPIDKSLHNALGLVESNQIALRQAAKRDADSAREMKDEVERSFMDAVAEFEAWSEKQLQLMEARWK